MMGEPYKSWRFFRNLLLLCKNATYYDDKKGEMMIFVILGAIAFIFLYIFDINKIYKIHKFLNILFALGVFLLVVSTLGILLGKFPANNIPIILLIVFGVLSIIAFVLMIYSLFFALPFNKTYVTGENSDKVIDTGMYAICRHPGVIWFLFFYLFLWLASGINVMFWAFLIWTIMDIIHVWVQDKYFFPKTLSGYDKYKMTTPFLVPNFSSIQRALRSTKENF